MKGNLVMMPHHPGDVIMALPAAQALDRLYPDQPVDFLVSPECASLLRGHPGLRRVWEVDVRSIAVELESGDASASNRRRRSLEATLPPEGYHLSLNLFQGRACAWLQGWIPADLKSGRRLHTDGSESVDGRVSEHLFAIPAERAANPFHATDLYIAMAREALGQPLFPPSPPFLTLPLPRLPERPDDALPWAERRFGVAHPGSAHAGKRWPDAHWRRFFALCLEAGMPLAITGTAEERDWLLGLLPEYGDGHGARLRLAAGELSLDASAEWIRRAAWLVAGDTVAQHMAAAQGTPVLALFGPSSPWETGPWTPQAWVACRPKRLGPDLAFATPDPDLASFTPEAVAGWLLRGKLSEALPLWEPVWRMGQSHLRWGRVGDGSDPVPASTGLWRQILAGDGFGGAEAANRDADHPLLSRLDSALRDPSPTRLHRLESEERAWAEATRDDLVWEAYRIALRGLPTDSVGILLQSRKHRLKRALWEASLRRMDGAERQNGVN